MRCNIKHYIKQLILNSENQYSNLSLWLIITIQTAHQERQNNARRSVNHWPLSWEKAELHLHKEGPQRSVLQTGDKDTAVIGSCCKMK